MATARAALDPAQVERLWTGYHPRAALPALVSATAISLLVWTGRWYLDELSELANRAGALAVFAIAWCLWPGLIAVYLYRAVTYTYRVTDRAVLIDFGFRNPPVAPFWLREVARVRTGASRVSALLGIGWVEVRTADRAVRLVGVRHPEVLAEVIRKAVADAVRVPDAGPRVP